MRILANKDGKRFLSKVSLVLFLFLVLSQAVLYLVFHEFSWELLLLSIIISVCILVICYQYLKKQDAIMEKAVSCAVGYATPERIDEINILQATYEAMRKAIAGLKVLPDALVNDAVTIPEVELPQVPVIKGDAKCLSVSAASILAKVTRDRIMEEADLQYPEYGFAAHKGYGTRAHIEALKKYGPCPIHRRSFITHFVSESCPNG